MSDERYNSENQENSENKPISNNPVPYSFWTEQIASTTPSHSENVEEIPRYSNEYNNMENKPTQYSSQNHEHISNTFDMSSDRDNRKKHKNGKPRLIRKVVKFILGAAIFGVIAGGTFIGANMLYYRINPDATPISISFGNDFKSFSNIKLNLKSPSEADKTIASTTVSKDVIQQKTDLTDVVEATMPSIVAITSTYTQTLDWFGEQYDEENQGGGSGIIVGQNETELLIATNNHVVEGADPILVTLNDGSQVEAIIKGTDATADLAVISIDITTISKETLGAIKTAKLGDSESVKVGQMAIAIGNALGYGQSLTVGYVSAKDREVAVDNNTMVLLQTDAAINPGNSGGALLNINGEVIGINSVKYASSNVEGMGYAIPISRAIPIINELMNREILAEDEKGYLGVYIKGVTEEIAAMYNWPVGVYVTALAEGGSAAKAGIVTGDIIIGVEGTEVTDDTQLIEKVTSYRVGTEITVTVMRSVNGEYVEKEIVVTLGQYPDLEEN